MSNAQDRFRGQDPDDAYSSEETAADMGSLEDEGSVGRHARGRSDADSGYGADDDLMPDRGDESMSDMGSRGSGRGGRHGSDRNDFEDDQIDDEF
ncbi:hypothetical protein [Actinomadura fibrosa]|uniref:DUF5709 domain-containing protein n=1 Tax=Actinomadura fibrosa TaxID=111802 RepID=A0ABW2XC22_9ACTN|nr:hypothetical protein [Actinomadura fibrosa]